MQRARSCDQQSKLSGREYNEKQLHRNFLNCKHLALTRDQTNNPTEVDKIMKRSKVTQSQPCH